MHQAEIVTLEVEVLASQEIHELPGDWGPAALQDLLADLEIDTAGASDADLLDLALMALGDLEPDDAGAVVLHAVFGETMSAGVRANLAADLEGDRPWEESADLQRQEGIFTAVVLLQQALPRQFGKPDATWAKIAITAPTPDDAEELARGNPAVLVRVLAPGLGSHSTVTCLYAEGVGAGEFPEAEHILWRRTLIRDHDNPRRVILEVYGSQSFLGTLEDAQPWQAKIKLS